MSGTRESMFFDAALSSAPDCTFITLRGELDLASAPILAEVVDRSLPHADGMVVFDLASLDFVDLAGTRSLVHAVTRARSTGRMAIALCPSRPVERVLRLLDVADELGLGGDGATSGSELQLSA